MVIYKIYIHDRNYSSWDVFDANKFEKIEGLVINPIESKLLSNDVFTIDKNNKVDIYTLLLDQVQHYQAFLF